MQWPEFADARRLARSTHPADRSLSHILGEIPGMATENKLRLLNCAVASLDAGEVYVEVGCYKGASLVGAAASNPHARIFACDNFSQFDGAADALRRTLDAHTEPGQVTFHDMDFRDFLAAAPWSSRAHRRLLLRRRPLLSRSIRGPRARHRALSRRRSGDHRRHEQTRRPLRQQSRRARFAKLQTNSRSYAPRATTHPTWWNGIQVYRYQRTPADSAIKFPNSGFAVRKLIYDDIFLEMKHRRRARRKIKKDRAKS